MIAVPHDKWGERPLLLVVPVPGESPSKDSLLGFLKVWLPHPWQQPGPWHSGPPPAQLDLACVLSEGGLAGSLHALHTEAAGLAA